MSTNQPASALTEQFATLNQNIITFVERCPDRLWRSNCANDGRSVAVVAHHIANSHEPIAQLAMLIATGQPIPALSYAMFDHANAQHAIESADCTQNEVSMLLHDKGTNVATLLSKLTPDQLVQSGFITWANATMSVQEVIEHILIAHALAHFATVEATANAQ